MNLIITTSLFLYFIYMILLNDFHKDDSKKYESINNISSIVSIIISFALMIFITDMIMLSLAVIIILIGYYMDNDINNPSYIKLYSFSSLLLFMTICIQLFV